MDAEGRYRNAQRLAHEGRHDEALAELIWFHQHALEHDPALYGVRRSYALGAWVDLAAIHLPARLALDAQRASDVAALLDGRGNRDHFLDVRAIDGLQQQEVRTHALYLQLQQADPALAQSCAPLMLSAAIAANDLTLAASLMPAPELTVRAKSRYLIDALAARRTRAFSRAPLVALHISLYTEDVRQVLHVLDGVGRHDEARRLRRLAADLIHATTIRREVRRQLSPA